MPDFPYGLGATPSPPDDRDYPVAALYAALGVAAPVALPAAYVTLPVPPILNQGDTPQCVAYSSAGFKQYQDYNDPLAGKWWNFDEQEFFNAIGGGPNGAYIRAAMDELLHSGYPVAGDVAPASEHRIAAYYAVPVDVASIKAAIASFGEVVFGAYWYQSWFTPGNLGILPAPDTKVGGHAFRVRGWDDARGFLVANTWGTGWGLGGECYLPYKYLSKVFEVWKAVDQEVKPPVHHWHVAKGATVKIYTLSAQGLILPGWETSIWTSNSSSAPSTRPVYRKTLNGKSGATTVKLLSGKFAGKTVQVAPPGTYVTA